MYKRLRKAAANIFEPDMVDDFCQFVQEQTTKNPKYPTKPWIFIKADFYRHTFGRTGTHRSNATHTQIKEWHESGVFEAFDRFDLYSFLGSMQLTMQERAVLILFYIWGMSFKEIGLILGIKQNTANKCLERTLKKLKECQ